MTPVRIRKISRKKRLKHSWEIDRRGAKWPNRRGKHITTLTEKILDAGKGG